MKRTIILRSAISSTIAVAMIVATPALAFRSIKYETKEQAVQTLMDMGFTRIKLLGKEHHDCEVGYVSSWKFKARGPKGKKRFRGWLCPNNHFGTKSEKFKWN